MGYKGFYGAANLLAWMPSEISTGHKIDGNCLYNGQGYFSFIAHVPE